MNRCNTCTHWDRKYHIEPGQRLCLAKKLDSTEPDGARIAYVERRHAMFLATSPDFGCVHHTPVAGVADGTQQLMKFYRVDSLAALVEAQASHVEKLQARLPPAPSFAPVRVREG